MHQINRLIFTLTLAIFCTSCMVQTPTPNIVSKQMRIKYLDNLQYWCAEGKVAIIDQQQNVNASYKWQQKEQRFQLYFFSPFSTESVTINGDGQQLQIIANNGEKDSEIELERHLPFAQLAFWIKGLPAPGSAPTFKEYDQYNQLQRLQQDGWKVEYQAYDIAQTISLPEKLTITNGRTKVKLYIKHWRIDNINS